ncbi:MAG: cation:proton antiporter subunit C [Methanomicrobia archaeon]|nr:cation:proton antiporter subunit C [Methanomicrobia archaeon]
MILNGIITGIILILIGLYGMIAKRHIFKIILGLIIISTGIVLFFVSLGYVNNGIAPIISGDNLYVDPLPHTLMLTTIVVEVCITSLALVLALKIYEKYKTLDIKILEDI